MNGPQHYQRAEQLLDAVDGAVERGNFQAADRLIARAAVHASLAAVAESANKVLSGDVMTFRRDDETAWEKATR